MTVITVVLFQQASIKLIVFLHHNVHLVRNLYKEHVMSVSIQQILEIKTETNPVFFSSSSTALHCDQRFEEDISKAYKFNAFLTPIVLYILVHDSGLQIASVSDMKGSVSEHRNQFKLFQNLLV